MKLTIFLLFLLGGLVALVSALSFPDISQCPPLPQRSPPESVHDLRPDDIKVIAAMGDSITAGLAAINVKTEYVSPEQFVEFRGKGFIMGGDPDSNSIANYIKHYNQDLVGASVGSNKARYCKKTFFCFEPYHNYPVDQLNAAQTGSTSSGLGDQVQYLLKYIGPNTPLAHEWKMIHLYIGCNDISAHCLPGMTPVNYGRNVYNNLKTLISNVDKAFINILSVQHFNELIQIPPKHPGYVKQFADKNINVHDHECMCCSNGGLERMGKQVDMYNEQLKEVVARLNRELAGTIIEDLLGIKRQKDVAVVYQPLDTYSATVPVDSISNLDGFHPNIKTYKFASRLLWRQLFTKKQDKVLISQFDENMPVYCPTAEDRLQT
ncbi:hypothetical protein RMATCC62417_07082 [Rhizopus microsporus]|nr:hypothetical protein RMATCC62417_07082 [Rhizopus microsporus]